MVLVMVFSVEEMEVGCRVFPRGRRRLLGYDVEDVDLVAGPAEVGERPVHHVLRLRVPVDGYEDLAQRWLALLAGVGVLRSLLGGEGIERKGQGVPVEGTGGDARRRARRSR